MASNDKNFSRVLEQIPCLFNISAMKKTIESRLIFLQIRFEEESQEEDGLEGQSQRAGLCNFLSWVYFHMGDLDKAKQKNNEALYEDPDNLSSLGNRAYLEWYAGADLTKYLKHLDSLKAQPDFEARETNARGFQAHFLLRIGGRYNLTRSIEIYRQVLNTQPNNYQWKYHLYLAMRRLAVINREDVENDRDLLKMFTEVAENASNRHLKAMALVEIASTWENLARENENLARENVRKALELDAQNATVLRKCGMTLARLGDCQAIDYLERADLASSNTVTKHQLAKCYTNPKLSSTRNQNENDLKAIRLFTDAYDLSFKDNCRPLLDLAFMYLLRKRTREAMGEYDKLIKNWTVGEPRSIPFMVAKICEGWQQMMKEFGTGNSRNIATALYPNLAFFEWITTTSERTYSFDKMISGDRMDRRARNLFFLLQDCNAFQIAKRMSRSGNLSDTACIVQEFESLISQGKAGEALVFFRLAKMSRETGDSCILPRHLLFQAMITEIEWQLNQGLMPCKLMFSEVFNKCYARDEHVEGNSNTLGEADVLILHDGLHWAPYYTQGQDELTVNTVSSRCRAYEDVIQYLFNLEVLTNPWLPLSDKNSPDPNVFSDLVHKFKVAIVLVVVDADTSDQFLGLIDTLLSQAVQEGGIQPTTAINVAVVCEDVERLQATCPFLANQRQFQPVSNGLVWHDEEKSIHDLMGREILDAYFQNDARNAIKFFKFLAPQTSEQ